MNERLKQKKKTSGDWPKVFSDTADLLPALICEIDRTFRVTYVNKVGLENIGYSEEEYKKGVYLYDMIVEDDRKRGLDNLSAILEGETVSNQEYKLRRKNGEIVVCEANSSPIYKDDKIWGVRTCLFNVEHRRAQEEARLTAARREAEEIRKELLSMKEEIKSSFTFANMVSRSTRMKEIFRFLPQIAEADTTAMIYGESGTGKELIARALHDLSPRKDMPFVAINCSALPDNLLESELFGHKAGAFTDAKKDRPGKFAQADGGVIFLDEIGDISAAMQAKLLRVLQERTIEPLGGEGSIKVNVRVVAATNKDLSSMVQRGEFRDDLFYRLDIVKVNLPPLRERRSDIPLLAQHFVELFNKRFKKNIEGLDADAMDALLVHDFPGNIRELENIVEHAFVFCKDEQIGLAHLPQELQGARSSSPDGLDLAGFKTFDDLEAAYLSAILEETGGNKLKAAARLGIHKATLFRKLKKLGLSKDEA